MTPNDAVAPLVDLRLTRGEPRAGKVIGPLAPDHPYAGTQCICLGLLGDGTPTQEVALAPYKDDEVAIEAYRARRECDVLGLLLHERCAGAYAQRLEASEEARLADPEDVKLALVANEMHAGNDTVDVTKVIASHMGLPVETIAADLGAAFATIDKVTREERGRRN